MSQIYWRQSPAARRGAPCLFLDRDGVLVREVGYLHRVRDVEVLAGAGDLVRSARAHGYTVGVVTNQAGVGRGIYGWPEFEGVQNEIARQLDGFEFDFTAACAAHPQAVSPLHRIARHPWRKPEPGMLLAAAAMLDLDLAGSILVGDHLTDVQAAEAAGVGRIVHVLTGHGPTHRAAVEQRTPRGGVLVPVQDLTDARVRLGL